MFAGWDVSWKVLRLILRPSGRSTSGELRRLRRHGRTGLRHCWRGADTVGSGDDGRMNPWRGGLGWWIYVDGATSDDSGVLVADGDGSFSYVGAAADLFVDPVGED